MPVPAQVLSRNCGIPYAVLVGFCAFGFQPLSLPHRLSRQENWEPSPPSLDSAYSW
jgi:hypothetical protein